MSRGRRILRLLGLATVALVVVCAGLFGVVAKVVRGEVADPHVAHPHLPRVTRAVAATTEAPVRGDAEPDATVTVHGTVTEPDGTPIAGASIHSGLAEATTGPDGSYALRLEAGEGSVRAEAFGHASGWETYTAEEGDDLVVDFVLEKEHEVRVWCAGLTDDDCGDVPLQCTSPWLLAGDRCHRDRETGETRCECPDGEVTVRGGGRSVRVPEGEQEAWLDFRDAGSMSGRVLVDGEPVSLCTVAAVRVPRALEDLPRGLVAARRVSCEEDGTFLIEGLIEGDWELDVRAGSKERILVPRHVAARQDVDVGDIEVLAGGRIAGVLVDGLTGEPMSYAPVLALRTGVGRERATGMGDETDESGHFTIEGLPPGEWTVAHPLSPQEGVTVTVREGQESRVEVRTSDATSLATNGFALQDEDGALVVSDVTPESPADLAGLEPGDRVTGVLIGGMDVSSTLGDKGLPFARMVLAHWDGPGVTLVVEGENGGEEEVPLEW